MNLTSTNSRPKSLPSSLPNSLPMNTALDAMCNAEPVLADAFAAFTAAAGRLEFSYQQLQSEVTRLREELEERNLALTVSLAENEKMRLALGRILDALPCGVIVLEAGNRVSFINPEAQRLLECSGKNAAESENVRTLVARRRTSAEKAAERFSENDQEFCVIANEKKRWLAVRSAGMVESGLGRDKATDASQVVLILRDTTMQREMEQEREEARRLIALAELSSVLAHEIRNPLGSMELLTELLMGTPEVGSEAKRWVEHLQAGVRSLSVTVNNVLRMHTMGGPVLIPLQLAPVLKEATNFVNPLAEQAGITLSLHESLGNVEIAANGGELRQVILNLALNALRHTGIGGQIFVNASINGEHGVAIEIRDTGCGILPEHLPHVFDAGFSTGNSSPGLGLAVCRKIVQQHGGTISADSELGKGTTFRMEFPIL
jgi:signal transduction histidine kinase